MRSPSPPPQAGPADTLFQHWQAEAVRLREAHWGPLEDRAACHAALGQPADLGLRILARSAWLASHGTLHEHLSQWARVARWALIALWLGAFLAGMGAAATALGHPQGKVNLALALLGLLGLHALTFLLWLASFLPGIRPSTALSRFWLWLTHRLAHGPDSALAAQALLSLLARARAWKAAIGLISHGAWCAAFLGTVPTLIVLLSARSYTFHWETTLLSPDSFIAFTRTLGYLPRLLGFPLPASPDIAASIGAQAVPAAVQAGWSLWLIGCVVVWGLLPRLIALIACALHLRHRLGRLKIDTNLPGWLELRERLLPTHETLGIDQPAPISGPSAQRHGAVGHVSGRAAIMGYELGTGLSWPPQDLPAGIVDLGRCDSRTDRARIRDGLRPPPAHLLLVCDARLTPDRGTGAWLGELHSLCPDLQVLCLGGSPGRREVWQEVLLRMGIAQAQSLTHWLDHVGGAHDE